MAWRREEKEASMRKSKNYIIRCLVLIVSALLFGCGEDTELDENTYKVYYLDGAGERLIAEKYTVGIEEKDTVSIATELIHALEKNGEGDRYTNPIEPDIEFDELQIDENQMSVYFTGAYNNKTGVTEVLSRAAIVKTLLQLKDIDKIEFFVEDQPLMVRGESVGQMDESSFVEDLGNRGEPQSRTVKLYFADSKGQSLIPIETVVTYPASEKMAMLLVDSLIAGPEAIKDKDTDGILRSVPAGTVLNNVTIRDNICYLDFSREFAELLPNVTSDVTVYSIVDTLCELPSISRVQFTINSGVRERYGETKGFNKALERNLDIIRS